MTTQRLAEILGIDEWPVEYSEEFERFNREWSDIQTLPLFDFNGFHTLCEEGFIDAACEGDVTECLRRIQADEELAFALQCVYYCLCEYRLPSENEFYKEPAPPSLGDYRFTFAMILLQKCLIRGVLKARERGISEDLIAQHRGAANGDRLNGTGPFGTPNMFHWRTVCSFATMYSLGAFRFEPERVPPGYRMLRRKSDQKLLMLYTAARDFDEFGQFAWSKETVAFSSHDAVGRYDGYIIAPDGRVLNQYVTLSEDEWEVAFDGGDTALSFHIPSDIPYNIEAAADSFCQASAFFKQYYPDMNVRSVQSYSWLYSPQLTAMLPEQSGINRFNRNVYLAPVPSGPDGFYSFVFKCSADEFDLDTVQTDTSLKRGFVSFVKNGGRVHNGFMYWPFDDVSRLGEHAQEMVAFDMILDT